MCGRYTMRAPGKLLAQTFQLDQQPDLPFRYNIAPTQDVPVVRQAEGQTRELSLLHWGLIPSWAKDPKIGNSLINARADTVATKPAYKRAFGIDRAPNPWADITLADVVFVVGANVAECAPITTSYVWRSRDRGGKLIVADPRVTPLARTAWPMASTWLSVSIRL